MDSRRIAQEDTLTAETTSSSTSTENTSSAVVKPATKPAMKRLRHVFIEAHFPELKGGQMYQHAHGEASGTKPAIARAFKNLLKTIPKKRISVIKATISITTKIVEDSSV